MHAERYLVTFLRWRAGEPNTGREIATIESTSPMAACDCPACDRPLTDNPPVRLLVLGPGDPEAQAERRAGSWHMATAIAMHSSCVGRQLGSRTVAEPFDSVDAVIDVLRHLGLPVF